METAMFQTQTENYKSEQTAGHKQTRSSTNRKINPPKKEMLLLYKQFKIEIRWLDSRPFFIVVGCTWENNLWPTRFGHW